MGAYRHTRMIRIFVLFDITATMAPHQEYVVSTIVGPFFREISKGSTNTHVCKLLYHYFHVII